MRRTILLTAVAVLLLGLAPTTPAQSGERIAVPLSDPGRPARLEVSMIMGSISVEAYDGKDVIIVATESIDAGPDEPSEENDGMRRIRNTSIGLTAEERQNTVSVDVDWTNREIMLEIKVPRRTSVHASTVNGGELTVDGVEGEHELSNVNGGITATNIAGSAVVGTTNGEVKVSFTELTPGKAMSFTSFNGDVDVTFPAGLDADLRINGGRGDVLTDFDFEIEPQSTAVEQSGDEGRYRVRLERVVRAVVGDGGPEMHFETFNGEIYIRKR